MYITECGHTFHALCIYSWWDAELGTASCPVCRKPTEPASAGTSAAIVRALHQGARAVFEHARPLTSESAPRDHWITDSVAVLYLMYGALLMGSGALIAKSKDGTRDWRVVALVCTNAVLMLNNAITITVIVRPVSFTSAVGVFTISAFFFLILTGVSFVIFVDDFHA